MVSKWISYFVDVDLFMDHGRSLSLFRHWLYLLDEHSIVKVWDYMETEDFIREWLIFFVVRDKREESLFTRKDEYNEKIKKSWFQSEESKLMKTSGSEFLFIILKNAIVADVNLKRQCGRL